MFLLIIATAYASWVIYSVGSIQPTVYLALIGTLGGLGAWAWARKQSRWYKHLVVLVLTVITAAWAHLHIPRIIAPRELPNNGLVWLDRPAFNNAEAIATAFDQPIAYPDGHSLVMVTTDGQSLRIDTPRQYLEALALDAFAEDTYGIAMSSHAMAATAPLQFLQRARVPGENKRLPHHLPPYKSLPADLGPAFAERPPRDQTWSKYFAEDLASAEVEHTKRGYNLRNFSGMDVAVEVTAMGDYDHDGTTDYLVLIATMATQGTYRGYTYVVLSGTWSSPAVVLAMLPAVQR